MSTHVSDSRFLVAGVEDPRPVLIIGGAGFVGSNLAHGILSSGQAVRVVDNLSRPGVEQNLAWLQDTHGDRLEVMIADVADRDALERALRGVSAIFHLAGQVAVTTSLKEPLADFEVNLRGTLNVLETLRAQKNAPTKETNPPPLLFTSTNKVYGGLEDVGLEETDRRYQPRDAMIRRNGIDEQRSLCLRSPYGCSKGGADQYVLDYAKTFGLRTIVFRMSCIYGPHQLGNEEQGWVAHFALRALQRAGITLYGDGKQVRDILHVTDLVDAMLRAMRDIDHLSGRAFNIGGGPERAVSLHEVLGLLESTSGEPIEIRFAPWRPGDQLYYVSDIRAFHMATGWKPQVDVRAGVTALWRWLREHRADPVSGLAGERISSARPDMESGREPRRARHAGVAS
jgi:CDP-paratose 2-epimerase